MASTSEFPPDRQALDAALKFAPWPPMPREMIVLTRANREEVVVNASYIVTVEATPDTLVTLYNGDKLRVRESPAEVRDRVIAYLRQVGWVAMLMRDERHTSLGD